MNLEEANDRLMTKINQDQLWSLNALYILLDLHKDDFCKIVNVVGLDALLKKQKYYEWLDQAREELDAKERYLKAKVRLEDLEIEKSNLEQIVNGYESNLMKGQR